MPYNLSCSDKLQPPKAKTTYLGIDTVKFKRNMLWETLPPQLKKHACSCRLGKILYPDLGLCFILYLHCNIICIFLSISNFSYMIKKILLLRVVLT